VDSHWFWSHNPAAGKYWPFVSIVRMLENASIVASNLCRTSPRQFCDEHNWFAMKEAFSFDFNVRMGKMETFLWLLA